MQLNRRNTLAALMISIIPGWIAAAAGDGFSQIEDPEARACLQRLLPDTSLSESILLRVFDDTGSISESAADLLWKRFDDGHSRALIRFTNPPRRSGIAQLVMEREDLSAEPDMYIYLPELRTTRRIVGKTLGGSMFDTDFSYEDFVQMQGIARNRSTQRLADADLDDRRAYGIETTPGNRDSEYSRVVTFVDQQWCVPLVTRFYGRDGSLHKELIVVQEEVRETESRWVPYRSTMYDRKRGGRTDLVVREIILDLELNDTIFTAAELRKGR
jgi:hypothetical protein